MKIFINFIFLRNTQIFYNYIRKNDLFFFFQLKLCTRFYLYELIDYNMISTYRILLH